MNVLLAVIAVVAALRLAQDVFIPVALAVLMTFLLAPVVDRMHYAGVNRAIAVALTVAVAFTLLGGLIYVVFLQFADLVQELPRYRKQLRANIAELGGALRGGVGEATAAVEQITKEIERAAPAAPSGDQDIPAVRVVQPAPGTMQALITLFGPFVKPVGTAALVVVFTIFMLLRYADLRDRLIRLLGSRNLRATTEALDDAGRRVSRYLVMQTLINGWQGFWVTVGLTLIGLPNAVLFGALTLVLRFIPYVGPWVAAAAPVALSFAVFDEWMHPLMTIALFVVLEAISNLVLEPWLYGARTGVSPPALLVAAAFWTWLWGPVGLFLAIPLTVCVVVMGKYIPALGFLYVLLGDQPVLAPHERLYQRLLAANREEADDLLDEELKAHPLIEVCDQVVVPAMQLAEADHDVGGLRESKRRFALDHIDRWADELLETVERSEAPASGPGTTLTVLCLPAADRADEIIAKLLCAVLTERGMAAGLVSRTGVRDLSREPTPAAMVVSALPPDAVVRARQACKQVRNQLPEVPIIVGLWNAHGDLQRSWQRLEPVGARRLVTSFAACVSHLQGLAEPGAARPSAPEVETASPVRA